MIASKSPKPAKPDAPTVDDYMAALVHPLKAEIQALRLILRSVDPKIAESIKWNAPSYSCGEHFATFNPRAKVGVQIVFHLGTKARPDSVVRTQVKDPAKLLQWLANDRATVNFQDMATVVAGADALRAIVRQWIIHV